MPRGIQLMRPNGTFYRLESGVGLTATPDGYLIGVRDANRVLRPFFCNRLIVKVKRLDIGDYDIIPLTLEEYRFYNFNSDIATNRDRFLQYIGERRA